MFETCWLRRVPYKEAMVMGYATGSSDLSRCFETIYHVATGAKSTLPSEIDQLAGAVGGSDANMSSTMSGALLETMLLSGLKRRKKSRGMSIHSALTVAPIGRCRSE